MAISIGLNRFSNQQFSRVFQGFYHDMTLLRILFWTAFLLAATTAHAHAGPLVAAIGIAAKAIGAALAAKGIVGFLAKAALSLLINVGVGLLQKALAKKPTQPGIKTQIGIGGDNPLSFIVGWYATPGDIEYVNTWGSAGNTPNAYLTMVISLSDMPVSGMRERIWVHGEACTLDIENADADLGWPVTEYDGTLWVKFYDGTQTEADAMLLDKFGEDADRPWTSDMIGVGVAYAIVTAKFDREKHAGPPNCQFEIDGVPLYDISKDTTAGGDGAHRRTDPSTWEPSVNLAVMIYNVICGISFDGTWIFGGQSVHASRLPAANWIAAIGECAAAIDLAEGGTEPQFRGGLEITVDSEPFDIVEELLKACNGRMAEIGGVYKVLVGAPGMPVYSFTDDDIVVTDGQNYDQFPGLENTYNGAHASYPEPAESWAAKDAPPYYSSDYEDADNGRRLPAALTYPAAPYATQVQRLMQAAVEEARRFRKHVITLPPEAWLYEPLDVFSWSSVRNGYEDKKFLVLAMDGQPGMNQVVTLQEIDPADYDWDPETDETPYSPVPLGPIVPPAQPVYGWAVEPWTINDSSATARRPAIRVRFAGDQLDVRAVRIWVRLEETGAIVFDGEAPYGDPAEGYKYAIVDTGILPAEDYEVSGIFVPFSGRKVEQSAWLAVTTPNAQFTTNDILDGAIDELKLADEAVSTAKLQVAAVTEEILAPDSVTNQKIADAAVEASQIAEDAVGSLQIAAGAVAAAEIAVGAVLSDRLGDAAVTELKIAADAVTEAKIAADAVTNGAIADAAVEALQIANGAVEEAKIAVGAVTETKLAADSVTGAKIAAGAVASSDLASAAVQAVNLADGAVESAKIAVGAVLSDRLGDAAVTELKIAADAVTAAKIAADAVGNSEIADGAVEALQIAAGAVEEAKIAVGAVTEGKLGSGSVTSGKIADAAVTSGKIDSSAVTETKIADDAISTPKLQANSIVGEKVAAGAITTRELLISDFTNLVEDPNFTSASRWTLGTGLSLAAFGYNANSSLSGTTVTDSYATMVTPIEMTGGVDLLVSGYVAFEGSAGSVSIDVEFRDKDDVVLGYVSSPPTWTPADGYSWVRKTINVTSPAGTHTARPFVHYLGVSGGAYTGFLGVTRRANGELIVDGAITALKIAADAVTSAAIQAGTIVASDIAAGTITGDKLVAATITGTYIAADAITGVKIAAGSIVASDIATGAVTADKILADSVTSAKILAGTITGSDIAAETITGSLIQAGTITGAKIAAETITGSLIQGATITGDKLVANSITAREMILTDYTNLMQSPYFEDASGWYGNDPALAYTLDTAYGYNSTRVGVVLNGGLLYNLNEAQVQEGDYLLLTGVANTQNITAGNLYLIALFLDENGSSTGNDAVAWGVAENWTEKSVTLQAPAGTNSVRVYWLADSFASGSEYGLPGYTGMFRRVNAQLIVDGEVVAAKIAADSITSAKIAAGSIVGSDIAADTITGNNIVAGTITSLDIATSAITSGSIVAGAITTGKIATDAVTSDKILAGTITASDIAAATITGSLIQAGTITGSLIQAGTITGSLIQAETITGDKLVAASITARELIITDYTNLVISPNFDNPSAWSVVSGTAFVSTTALGYNSDNAAYSNGTGSVQNKDNLINVSPDDRFLLAGYGYNAASGGNMTLFCVFYDKDGGYIGISNFAYWDSSDAAAYTRKEAEIIPPSNAATMLVQANFNGVTGFLILGYVGLYRKASGSLIVDGAVTANKIGALSVTAGAIAAGSVTTEKIAAGAVTAEKITVGSLVALSAVLGAVDISAAIIGSLQVGSANIADAAITSSKTQPLDIGRLH